jgi:hypothetical protein
VETERPENDLLDERGTDQGLLLQGTEMVEMIDGMSISFIRFHVGKC